MLMGVGEGSPPAKRLRSMQRSWKITLAGAGTAVAAAGPSVLLVLLLPGRPAARQRAVPVMYMGHPVRMMHLRDLRTAVPAQLLSPFTGEPVKALGRVVVAKIDNIADARPPTNLTSADIVDLLPVDAGLSPIFARYSSRIPNLIS